VLGAMSAATPGAQPSRKILTEPIGCMFLAGEATHDTMWGTVDGAWDSGERAADAALRKIGALKDTESAPAPPVARSRHRAAPARRAPRIN
jgi:flavin-dependent amine oxidoreductase